MTLVELTVSTAVVSLLLGSLMVGIIALRRSFEAAKENTKSQLEQVRFIDYVSRDLRRALAVQVDTYQGSSRISMTIPDYYTTVDGAPQPRTPQINGDYADYGTTPAVVRYYKDGSTLVRRFNGVNSIIASDVEDFQLSYPPATNQQVINVAVTFLPRFRLSASRDAVRAGTSANTSILLRNKRLGATVPSSP
jgi:type II secretory pathway component PulJ